MYCECERGATRFFLKEDQRTSPHLSVEATATNLRQRGESLSSAKSYVLHIGRLARFGTFVSSEEAVGAGNLV